MSIQSEFDVVFKAAEQHRHNYYAFQYARRLLDLSTKVAVEEDSDTKYKRDSNVIVRDVAGAGEAMVAA